MPKHEHKFQKEGSTWACFGWEGSCGLRAPTCFTPKPEACTPSGLHDLQFDMFVAEHFIVVRVP